MKTISSCIVAACLAAAGAAQAHVQFSATPFRPAGLERLRVDERSTSLLPVVNDLPALSSRHRRAAGAVPAPGSACNGAGLHCIDAGSQPDGASRHVGGNKR